MLENKLHKKRGFTLAEVLITLAIVGVVAVMLLSTVRKIQDIQFRNAYKKAYADINQAFREPISNGELTRTHQYMPSSTKQEFDIMKRAFKVQKECVPKDLYDCWPKGEGVWKNTIPSTEWSYSFIDASGRSWATYNVQNLFLVDTNGFTPPNKMGKDRFIFQFKNSQGVSIADKATDYAYMGIYHSRDTLTKDDYWCHYPPCYFKSWLK